MFVGRGTERATYLLCVVDNALLLGSAVQTLSSDRVRVEIGELRSDALVDFASFNATASQNLLKTRGVADILLALPSLHVHDPKEKRAGATNENHCGRNKQHESGGDAETNCWIVH